MDQRKTSQDTRTGTTAAKRTQTQPQQGRLQKRTRLQSDAEKEKKTSNKQFIILGRGRCGTSMLALVLSKLGVEMMDGNINEPQLEGKNVYGYYENGDFHQIFQAPSSVGDRLAEYKDKPGIWGWKDHRSLFYLDEILENMEDPHFFICSRDQSKQVQSMSKHLWGNKLPITHLIRKLHEYNNYLEE